MGVRRSLTQLGRTSCSQTGARSELEVLFVVVEHRRSEKSMQQCNDVSRQQGNRLSADLAFVSPIILFPLSPVSCAICNV